MAVKVAGELKDTLLGQLYEIERQIRQSNGYGFNPFQLKHHLQAGIEGRFRQTIGSFRFDKRNDGWMLLENVSRRLTSANVRGCRSWWGRRAPLTARRWHAGPTSSWMPITARRTPSGCWITRIRFR